MCELFGISAAQPAKVNELLDAFFQHSREHKDGWGLAVFHGKGVSLEKEPVRALDSLYLKQRMTREISGANMLAHIRKATIGRIEYANCHPFVWDDESGRTWALIHNGTVFEGECLCPYLDVQEGTTDSERLLLYIVDKINEAAAAAGHALTADERFRILDEFICALSAGNKLNLLLYDGECLYAHTNCADGLYSLRTPDRIVIATRPLLTDGWEKLPENRLFAFRDGRLVRKGTGHGHSFREEDHDMTWLYSAFAEL